MDARRKKLHAMILHLAALPGWSQAKVARLIRMSAPHLSSVLAGTTVPTDNTVDRIEPILMRLMAENSPDNLPADLVRKVREIERKPPIAEWQLATMGRRADPLPDIPIYTTVPAGPLTVADIRAEPKTVGRLPRDFFPYDARAFALEVAGESMVPWVNPGDLVIVSRGLAFQDGGFPDGSECVIVQRDSVEYSKECLKRVFRWADDKLRLESWNPAYKPKIIPMHDVDVLPVVARVFRDWKRMDATALKAIPREVPPTATTEFVPQRHPDYSGGDPIPED